MDYDIFYEIKGRKSIIIVKRIFTWAKNNAFKTEVHMRIAGKLARENADKN